MRSSVVDANRYNVVHVKSCLVRYSFPVVTEKEKSAKTRSLYKFTEGSTHIFSRYLYPNSFVT